MAYFYYRFRKSSLGKNHKGSLFIRLAHDNFVRSITTPFKVYPHEWDEENRQIILPDSTTSDRYTELQQIIAAMKKENARMDAIIAKFDARDRLYTVFEVGDYYRDEVTIVPILPFAKKQSELLAKKGQHRTARGYITVLNSFIEYTGNPNVTFGDLTDNTINQYEAHMKKNGKSLNTISFHMRNLRAIYNKAIQKKLILGQFEDPFRDVYTGVEKKSDY